MVGTRPWKFPWFQRASFTLGVGLGAVNTLYPLYLNHPLLLLLLLFFLSYFPHTQSLASSLIQVLIFDSFCNSELPIHSSLIYTITPSLGSTWQRALGL